MPTIGFIGLGNMGSPMAANLIKHQHQVHVFDLNQQAVAALQSQGAIAHSDAISCCHGADYVITMLSSGDIVKSVYLHQDKLFNTVSNVDSISTAPLFIDCSTIAPEDSKVVAAKAAEKGIRFIDAPVSGGVAGASKATLTFICGGSLNDVNRARPILECMGKNIFHAGPAGLGQAAKICNNMLLAIHMVGTSEALQLGVDQGLDPAVLSEIMLQSSGRNWSLELYNPYPGVMPDAPASDNYAGGFMVSLMNKDLRLAADAAKSSHSKTPLGERARQLYAEHEARGHGALDFSSILRLLQQH